VGQSAKIHVAVYDQFGDRSANQPAAYYAVDSGPGNIGTNSGVFSSPVMGSALIGVLEGNLTGTAQVEVIE
jgi:hypothetical protein